MPNISLTLQELVCIVVRLFSVSKHGILQTDLKSYIMAGSTPCQYAGKATSGTSLRNRRSLVSKPRATLLICMQMKAFDK
jgi:hypothetical protein